MNKNKLLVTSGSGFYGSLLINKLIPKGYTVIFLDLIKEFFLSNNLKILSKIFSK